MTAGPLLLDFDGVVLETVDVKEQAFRQLFAGDDDRLWVKIQAEHQASHGQGRSEKIRRFFAVAHGRAPTPEEQAEALERFAVLAMGASLGSAEVPGVVEFLSGLEVPVYVITAAPETEVHDICERRGLVPLFRAIFGRPRAKEELIAEACRREGRSTASSLFVGDRVSDYMAARAAGARFIGRVRIGMANPFPAHVPVISDFVSGGDMIRRLLEGG